MERYKCKLCSREFANGRALGGHMKSHLAIPPKTAKKTEQLSERTESSSSLSFSEQFEEEDEVKAVAYGLRENPKRSFKLADPKFSDAGSVIEDTESETESSRNPTRRQRVKRTRKVGFAENPELGRPRIKLSKPSSTESVNELEEEYCVARCLMMLSRDTTWWRSTDSDELRLSQSAPKRYECETCKKVFKSFQALGGHRTSHKKLLKSCDNYNSREREDERVHKCPICSKVFGSGQALGGHKRSHFLTASSSSKLVGPYLVEKSSETLIDLNFPAPMEEEEEDDSNQLEVSAVSDANPSH